MRRLLTFGLAYEPLDGARRRTNTNSQWGGANTCKDSVATATARRWCVLPSGNRCRRL